MHERKWKKYSALAGKPERNRSLWGPRRKWEDNINVDIREIEWGA
jgi:hypothetical protein